MGRINHSDWLVCQGSLCTSLFKRTSSCFHQLDVIQALFLIFIYCLCKECNTSVLRHSCEHTQASVCPLSPSPMWSLGTEIMLPYFIEGTSCWAMFQFPGSICVKYCKICFYFPQGSTLGALIILGMVLIMFWIVCISVFIL